MNEFKGMKMDLRIGLNQAIKTGLIIGIAAGVLSYVDYRRGCLYTALDFMGNFGDVIMAEAKSKTE